MPCHGLLIVLHASSLIPCRVDRPNRDRDNEPQVPLPGSSSSMARLLLIDDDPAVVPEQVRQAFLAPRYRFEVAATGAEALAQVGARPPDVILLDLRLPDQTGLEIYQQIRSLDARIPVIFI